MRVRTLALQLLTICIGLLGLAGIAARAAEGNAEGPAITTSLRLTLDHPIDATAAPFLLATSKGYFQSAGLNVTIDVAKSVDDAITRVATGNSDIALADINALMRFRDSATAPPVKAVFVLFNAAPYAIIARKSRGIRALVDIEGKTLGVADGDLAIRLWPALAEHNGLKIKTVKQQHISAAVREPMLSAGQVDAVTGFSYLSALNLKDRGVPADDLAVLRFADYGSNAYGAALIVNPAFAARKPEAVRAFLRAVVMGLRLTIQEPAAAIDAVMARMSGGSRELELERLRAVLRDNILTAEARHIGFGAIDTARLDKSIDEVGVDFKFRQKPAAADIFDPAFLPPADERKLK
jgi:NitT/TauT family transport system substrate-binding protein